MFFKGYVRYFFIFAKQKTLQKLSKMFFMTPKKLFSLLKYLNVCISFSSYFFPYRSLKQESSVDNFKVHDVITYIDWDLETHYLGFLGK